MRLTALGSRLAIAAALAAVMAAAGCRRVPYIDQSKPVPHEPGGLVAKQDAEIEQTQLLESGGPIPLPMMSDPRTTTNPEGEEIWYLSLEEAIRIGLDNAEVIRVIPLGAGALPVGGFEPSLLQVSGIGAVGAGSFNALGSGSLATVYDPAIAETRIANALSRFDANFQTQLFWSRNVQPFNNAISTGFIATGNRFPVVSIQDSAQFSAAIQKYTATGSTLNITHNVNYQYSNSPINVFPSAYTTNLQFRFSQPLLGSAPTSQFNPSPNAAGLEANRAPIVVARLRADFNVWQFKSQVMALVRSIEQQYWALEQAQIQYWAAGTAVDLGEQIVRRELARFEIGQGSRPNVAEAEEQLERFRLTFVTRTAELVRTERQLRNLLGLPPSDNRRIVPSTPPTDAMIVPSWQAALRQMLDFQPDIVQAQLLVRVAELQLLVARNQLLPVLNFDALYQLNGLGHHLDQAEAVMTGKSIRAVDPIIQVQQRAAGLNPIPGLWNNFQTWQLGFTFQVPLGYRGPMSDVRLAQYQLLQQRAFLQQIVHQTTHLLHQYFLEVDLNYKSFRTASRLKAAAKERLEAAKAFYEQGTVTIDRYLDALNRWADAVAQEADFRNRYNTAIILLEEVKGTLLAYNNIAMAEGPWPAKAYIQAQDQIKGHRRHEVGDDGDYHPRPVTGPVVADPVPPMAPPNAHPEEPVPALPSPGGPLPPQPIPSHPAVPAGEVPVLMRRGESPPSMPALPIEPEVLPASAPAEIAAPPMEVPLDLPPAPDELPALPGPGDGPAGDLPTLPGAG
jgi:outer membrane protein TolC